MDNQHTPYVSKRKHCWKSPRKNTLKQFLDEKLELGLKQLFWENKEMKIFGVKSLHRSTKNYCPDEGEIFYQYSLWKKLTTGAPKGAHIYKHRLRKALLKAKDVVALTDRDVVKGVNACRYYQFVSKTSKCCVKPIRKSYNWSPVELEVANIMLDLAVLLTKR